MESQKTQQQQDMDVDMRNDGGGGTVTLPNGSVYTGQRLLGKKHGQGQQVWPDGSRYDGMWENDQANG